MAKTPTNPKSTKDKIKEPARRWRTAVAWTLLILGVLLIPISAIGVWTRNQLLDTDRYIATIKPLASDPAIQTALATSVTTNIFADNRVKNALQKELPDSLDFLATPATIAMRQATYKITLKAVQDKKFETVWVDINRVAHKSLVEVLTGNGNVTLKTKRGDITLNLTPLYEEVSKKLEQTSFGVTSKIPFSLVSKDFVLGSSPTLASAQSATNLLDRLANILPWLTLGLFAGSIAAAKNKRKAAFRVGLGIVVISLLLAVALALGRSAYVNAAASNATGEAAQTSVYNITLRFLIMINRTLVAVGLIIAITAGMLGESRAALKVRAFASTLTKRAGDAGSHQGILGGPVSKFVAGNLVLLQSIGVVLAFLAFMFISAPSPMTVVWLALITAVVEIVLIIVSRGAKAASAEAK